MGEDAPVIRREFQARLGRVAQELARELYPEGLPRGTKFSELEGVAGALGDEVARQLIEIGVPEQAEDWPDEELGECPACGGPPQEAGRAPRAQDHAGEIAWRRRVGSCPHCRRAFSPSGSGVGD